MATNSVRLNEKWGSKCLFLRNCLVTSMNTGSLSGRTGAIREIPKGKNKYTLAPIDH
jgi:hypothetical protein